MLDIFLLSFTTLFVIIDPIGIMSLSLTLTMGREFSEKRAIIIRAALTAFIVLVLFGLAGEKLIAAIGIGIPAFRISGGALLFLTALEILFQKRQTRRTQNLGGDEPNFTGDDPTIFPLAFPLMAGPGAMTSMILLTGQYPDALPAQALIYVALALVMMITIILALSVNRISHLFGDTSLDIINRILGMLLAALAVQFIADGVHEYITKSL